MEGGGRRRRGESHDARSPVTGFVDAFEKRVLTQRGFNYADITVIKPINACHCTVTAGPHRLLRPIHNHGRGPLHSTQKHPRPPWDTAMAAVGHPCLRNSFLSGTATMDGRKLTRSGARDSIRLIETRTRSDACIVAVVAPRVRRS